MMKFKFIVPFKNDILDITYMLKSVQEEAEIWTLAIT